MTAVHHDKATDADRAPVDVRDPRLTRFDIVKEGLRRDDIEVVTYESQFQGHNSRAEKRVVRNIALLFLISGGAALAFLGFYIWWPWRFELGHTLGDYYTPLLGITLGISLFALGFAILAWAKKLLPHEVSIQQRHELVSDEEQVITGQTMLFVADELSVQRRPLLKGAIALGLAPLGLVAAAPLIGGLIRAPHKADRGQDPPLYRTGFSPVDGKLIRLTREDGSPIRPEDVSTGGQMTVFPGVPHGATNEYADSPTLLIHLRADDAADARRNADADPINKGSMFGDYIAYSKICTHAGCPASLYEQQTNRLLCPCHQSQFLITRNAQPIFGPASRRLPMLPLGVDDEGFFVATSDYKQVVGPDFWERP